MGSRIGSGNWTCVTYDGRGRPTLRTIPAFGGAPPRSVDYNWAVGANPLITSVHDPAGTITTTTPDLLDRPVSYTDTAGNTTTSTYDRAGRLVTTAVPARGWSVGMEHDDADRPTRQLLEGAPVAVPTYDPAGELSSVDYALGLSSAGNGTALSAVTRDPAGRLVGLEWKRTLTDTVIASDAVTRSQSGRVMADTVNGVPTHTYTYDAAGRLAAATAPGHSYAYGYATTGGCGPLAGAGRNSNRIDGVASFFAQRLFGPERSELLAADLGEVDRQADRAWEATRSARQAALDDIERRQARLIEALETHDDPDGAVFERVRERLSALERERRAKLDELTALEQQRPATHAQDPRLLNELPILDIDFDGVPEEVLRPFFEAFNLEVRYDKHSHHATVRVCISDDAIDTVLPAVVSLTDHPRRDTGSPRPRVTHVGGAPGRNPSGTLRAQGRRTGPPG